MRQLSLILAIPMIGLAGQAFANDYYVGGSIGILNQSDSSNSGETGAFTTGDLGDDTTLDVVVGTDYGWDTEFDTGTVFSLEVGKKKASGLRLALEGVYSQADVDTHTDVTLSGSAIGALDAAAIAGADDPLGVTIAEVVADGQGDLTQTALFVNAYYDFNKGGTLQPYLGVGLGISDVNVEYSPSDIGVIDDGQTKFAYQGKAGVTFVMDSPLEIFVEAAYRATDDIETDNDLFPGTLDIENEQTTLSAGLRFKFGQY